MTFPEAALGAERLNRRDGCGLPKQNIPLAGAEALSNLAHLVGGLRQRGKRTHRGEIGRTATKEI